MKLIDLSEKTDEFTNFMASLAKQLNPPGASVPSTNQQAIIKKDLISAKERLLMNNKFSVLPTENRTLSKKLIQRGVKPTVRAIRNLLVYALLTPSDEIPEPERSIILRNGRKERLSLR
ncbi:MAG: hypothetical protein MN733_23020 [Nitrososphaera sp.]|nr:hypothetical protein [Nitrososphaera sp.]